MHHSQPKARKAKKGRERKDKEKGERKKEKKKRKRKWDYVKIWVREKKKKCHYDKRIKCEDEHWHKVSTSEAEKIWRSEDVKVRWWKDEQIWKMTNY